MRHTNGAHHVRTMMHYQQRHFESTRTLHGDAAAPHSSAGIPACGVIRNAPPQTAPCLIPGHVRRLVGLLMRLQPVVVLLDSVRHLGHVVEAVQKVGVHHLVGRRQVAGIRAVGVEDVAVAVQQTEEGALLVAGKVPGGPARSARPIGSRRIFLREDCKAVQFLGPVLKSCKLCKRSAHQCRLKAFSILSATQSKSV